MCEGETEHAAIPEVVSSVMVRCAVRATGGG